MLIEFKERFVIMCSSYNVKRNKAPNPNGRPKLPEEKKKKHLMISATTEEQNMLKQLAKDKGMTVSELVTSYARKGVNDLSR